MNEKTIYLSYWVRRYLTDYMLAAKNLSRNTVRSYRDTSDFLLATFEMSVIKIQTSSTFRN